MHVKKILIFFKKSVDMRTDSSNITNTNSVRPMTNCRRDTWRDDEGRDRRVKALARVGDKKELAKSTKNSRERIRGAEENLTLDP